MAGPVKSSPKDAQVMSAILKDMGVPEYEPRLINQMLEFTYRYVTDVLDDAKVYSSHANRKGIDIDDIKMAVQIKMDHSFTSPPPRDLLMEIARQKNSQALPLVKPYCGPRLPPDRFCLSAPNYKLRTVRKPRGMPYSVPMNQRLAGIGAHVKTVASPSLTLVTKNLTQPTVTILNKQPSTPTIMGGSNKAGTTPKPLVRVNPAIGASGLTRIISTGNTPIIQPVASSSSSSSLSSLSSSSLLSNNPPLPSSDTSSIITVNPLKRKFEDDDYDNA